MMSCDCDVRKFPGLKLCPGQSLHSISAWRYMGRSMVITLVVRTWQESDWPIHGSIDPRYEKRTEVRTSGLNSHLNESYLAWGT